MQAKCKHCGYGHWTVSCPKKEATPSQEGDNFLVDSFLIKDGEPEPADQTALLDKVIENWRRK